MKSQNKTIKWSHIEKPIPAKKEFKTWEKFVEHMRMKKCKMSQLQNKMLSKWNATSDDKCIWDENFNTGIKIGRICHKTHRSVPNRDGNRIVNVEKTDESVAKVSDIMF